MRVRICAQYTATQRKHTHVRMLTAINTARVFKNIPGKACDKWQCMYSFYSKITFQRSVSERASTKCYKRSNALDQTAVSERSMLGYRVALFLRVFSTTYPVVGCAYTFEHECKSGMTIKMSRHKCIEICTFISTI